MLHNPNYDFNDEVLPAGVAGGCAGAAPASAPNVKERRR